MINNNPNMLISRIEKGFLHRVTLEDPVGDSYVTYIYNNETVLNDTEAFTDTVTIKSVDSIPDKYGESYRYIKDKSQSFNKYQIFNTLLFIIDYYSLTDISEFFNRIRKVMDKGYLTPLALCNLVKYDELQGGEYIDEKAIELLNDPIIYNNRLAVYALSTFINHRSRIWKHMTPLQIATIGKKGTYNYYIDAEEMNDEILSMNLVGHTFEYSSESMANLGEKKIIKIHDKLSNALSLAKARKLLDKYPDPLYKDSVITVTDDLSLTLLTSLMAVYDHAKRVNNCLFARYGNRIGEKRYIAYRVDYEGKIGTVGYMLPINEQDQLEFKGDNKLSEVQLRELTDKIKAIEHKMFVLSP